MENSIQSTTATPVKTLTFAEQVLCFINKEGGQIKAKFALNLALFSIGLGIVMTILLNVRF